MKVVVAVRMVVGRSQGCEKQYVQGTNSSLKRKCWHVVVLRIRLAKTVADMFVKGHRWLQYNGKIGDTGRPASRRVDEWVDGDGGIYGGFGALGEVSMTTAMFFKWIDAHGIR